MYKVNLAFLDDVVRIEVKDADNATVLRSLTMIAPLLALCTLGTDYAVEATAPALPQPLTIRVSGEEILITNPTDPDRPILFKKADLVAAVVKGQLHGQEKQVVERPDTHPGSTEGRDFGTCPGILPNRNSDPPAYFAGASGADGQSGPSEAAPL